MAAVPASRRGVAKSFPFKGVLWLVAGSGRCGLQLARNMAAAGLRLAGVVLHRATSRAWVRRVLPDVPVFPPGVPLPRADAILVAVPDRAIAGWAAELAARLPAAPRVALHTSGLLPGRALAPLGERGASLGSFHPLLAFPSASGPLAPLAGALAAIEGEGAAIRAASRLARALGMRPRRLEATDKPAYHAAAAIAANLTHVLVVEARRLLQGVGYSRSQAAAALAPLISASLAAALAARGLERLTGPLTRGDRATVAAHLATLDAPLAAAYRAVARLALARFRDDSLPNAPGARGRVLE